RVLVRITIGRNGELLKSELVESSGMKKLDRLAFANLKRAEPLPSLPSELSNEPLVLIVPFNFTLPR
nr:TonB C-terminal domain-containing protein [Alphaproteobacteria bacterium]